MEADNMTKIGVIELLLETVFVSLLVFVFPFSVELKVKLIVLYVFLQMLIGRYRGKSLLFYEEIKLLLISMIGYLIGGFLIIPTRDLTLIRILYFIAICAVIFVFDLLSCRYSHILLRKCFKKNVVIVGIGHTAQALYNVCRGNRFSLMDVLCFISCNGSKYLKKDQEHVVNEKPIYKVDDIETIIEQQNIDAVILAIPEMPNDELKCLIGRIQDKVKTVKYLPQVPNTINFDSKIEDFDGLLMISSATGIIKIPSRICKRLIDILGSLVGLLLLIPITIFVYVKNRSEGDKDPIFFTQERIGKNGKTFKIYKFRTMVPDAEQVLEELMEKDPVIREEYTKNKKLVNDPRITKAGKFLREKSLDEFPQFINVLLGQMSLIGPRPYLPREKEDMGKYYKSVIACTPGLTGMWQTHGRSNVTFEYRLELDDYYYRNWSFWLDITLFLKTIRQVLYGNGAM